MPTSGARKEASGLLEVLDPGERAEVRRGRFPRWIGPMLARLTHEPFSDPAWIYERKLDGERVLAYVDGDGVRLLSRNRKELGESYPEIAAALRRQASGACVLDGEVVAFDSSGVSDFQRLQPRMQASSARVARASRVAVFYYVFDCMYAAGCDLTRVGLRGRKKVLRRAIAWGDPLRFCPHRNGRGVEYFREACGKGWEGVIAKRAASRYVHGRSSEWLKFKCVEQQELVICGFTDPEGERVGFGALLVGFYRDGELVYAGKVGTGFDDRTLEDLRARLDTIERQSSPFDRGKPPRRKTHFVAPELVCEVGFTEWTEGDKLRHPRFLGLRRDKAPKEVHKEDEAQIAKR